MSKLAINGGKPIREKAFPLYKILSFQEKGKGLVTALFPVLITEKK